MQYLICCMETENFKQMAINLISYDNINNIMIIVAIKTFLNTGPSL